MTDSWTGGQYSLFRMLLGAWLAVHFAMLLPYGSEVFSAAGAVADAAASPLFGVLPNPLWLNDSAWVIVLLLGVGCLCGLALCVGGCDRSAAILGALILAWLFQRNPLIANPSLPLLGWMLVLHAFVPPHPYGSLAGARHGTDPAWRLPGHLHAAAWVMLALCYSYSGWTKLASPSWVDGDTVRLVLENPLARDHLLREWMLDTPQIALQVLTWSVLMTELLFAPLALHRRLRPWMWSAMLAAQLGFFIFLDFADLTFPMLLAHLLTFDPAWVSRYKRGDTAVVLFDGDCAFCHASVRLAIHEDACTLLRFAPLGGRLSRLLLHDQALSRERHSIVVIGGSGEIELKSRAVAAVLERLGGLWLMLAVLLRCVPRTLADGGYDLVGRWRYRLAGRQPRTACPSTGVPGARMLS